MLVHNDMAHLPAFVNAVITIGTFDGVHKGHQHILEMMKSESASTHGETVIISFTPHPRQVIAGDNRPVSLLSTLSEKKELLGKAGIDHLVIVPFTPAFAQQSAEEYIEHFLVNTFHPHTIIIGYDHRFGKNRAGDYKLLEEKGMAYNYSVKEIPVQMQQDIAISSTRIRSSLLEGTVEEANELLGYRYFFSGTVIRGNQLGRTIGFPTANILPGHEGKLVPGNGVYAVFVKNNKDGISRKGMMNIGMRPTVNGTSRMTEVNIFDFDEDIYGDTLTIELAGQLRKETRFENIQALKYQLNKDRQQAQALLNGLSL